MIATAQPVERFFQFSLLGLLTSGYLAVVSSGTLDLPTVGLTGLALIVRGLMIAGLISFQVPENWVAALSLGYIGFYPLDYFFISGDFLQATVHFIFLLAILRVLSARSARDYAFVKLIAFLELLAASTLSSSLSFFAFLIAFLVFGVATFASAEIRRSLMRAPSVTRYGRPRFHRRLSVLVTGLSLAILVMTSALFFLLPRTAQAAFRHLVSQKYFLPGFSNQVTLGQIGELKQETRTVMRAHVDGVYRNQPLKWRGGALSEFDGRRWFNSFRPTEMLKVDKTGAVRLGSGNVVRYQQPSITYEVRINAMETDALFVTGEPEFLRITLPRIIRGPGESLKTGALNATGAHYYGISHDNRSADGHPVTSRIMPPGHYELNLLLPDIDPRIRRLAADLTRMQTPLAQAASIERHLREEFGYTTELLTAPVADPIAHFLFERKKGHCEYFASAMAVMLRTLGIPARMATGFQSGIYNDLTGWTLLRAADAHTWVEAWIEGYGWVTFDPTPPDPMGAMSSLWQRISLYADAAETFWQEWVLNYDLERQLTLAAQVETSGRLASFEWVAALRQGMKASAAYGKKVVVVLVLAGGLGLLVWFFGPGWVAWWRSRQGARRLEKGEISRHDATVLYRRMLLALQRKGLEKPAWLTPAEFARIVPETHNARLVLEITQSYNELRYGNRREAGARMLTLVRELERPAAVKTV